MAVPVELCPSLHPELDISLAGRAQSCFSCCNFFICWGLAPSLGEPKGLQDHGGMLRAQQDGGTSAGEVLKLSVLPLSLPWGTV